MIKQIACLTCIAIVGLAGAVSAGTYSGGDGSEADPYRISTPEDMQSIGANPGDWGSHFVLVNDINLAEYTGTQFNIIGTSWTNPFTSVFDGNGHTISNFTYTTTDTDYIGLFGYVDDANALIKDLTLVTPDVNAAGYSDYVASLVGRLQSGTITGCGIEDGSVTGDDCTGGLVGFNRYGTISNCYAVAGVSGDCFTGGLVGSNYGTISNCHSEGSVTGTSHDIGGLVGNNWFGTISNCYAEGSVTGTDDYTGGLVGSNSYGTISNCCAAGSVAGDFYTGGLVGFNDECTISNCYAVGSVAGTINTGGLVGHDTGTGSYVSSFWNHTVNSSLTGIGNITDPPEVVGESTVNMQKESTFASVGWDFVDIWDICEGTNYPKLVWQMIMLGDFVCPDGVEINDLDVFMQQWLMEKLSADIAPSGGDGVVDFVDWAVIANGWQNTTDINDVAVFTGQWLQFGAYCADIAPTPAGDGVVDMLDFAVLANNWLAESIDY